MATRNKPATQGGIQPSSPESVTRRMGHPQHGRSSLFSFSTDHRVIGRQYFFLALAAVLVGMALSLLMRVHVVWPAIHIPFLGQIKPEQYLAYLTMHGTLMVFFVLSTAPQNAFGNLVLAEQLGARSMAFPRLNMLSFWTTLVSFLTLISALFPLGVGSR